MSSPPLSVAVASAKEASERALAYVAYLAEALGTPKEVASVLAEAKAALWEVETALAGLEEALVAEMASAAPVTASAMPGLNAEGLYKALGLLADASAAELERELKQNRRLYWGLWLGRTVAVVLMLLCAPLLSLDVVREALGVTQESHLVPSLAALALICQVALWGMRTSNRHLATAAKHQRHQAQHYRHLARDVTAATAAATETAEVIAAANVTLETLEKMAGHLRSLVDAVTQDLEMGQGFPVSARALGYIMVALGTAIGDKEAMERLARVLEALPGHE